MRMNTLAFVLGGCLLLGQHAFGQADFQITELYPGIAGPNGSEDFIEITNLGDAAGSLDGLFYDDESLGINSDTSLFDPVGVASALPNFTLAPGEQAIILVGIDDPADFPAAIAEFESVFGTFENLAAVGGGGLSGDGDTAALLDGSGVVLDSVTYDAVPTAFSLTTIDISDGETLALTNQAVPDFVLSNPFANEAFPPATSVQIAHSLPVTPVPEPTALILVSASLVGFATRRSR